MSIYDSLSQPNTGGVASGSIYDSLSQPSTPGKSIYDGITPPPQAPVAPTIVSKIAGGINAVASDVKDAWNTPQPISQAFTPQNVLDRTQNWGEAVIKGWSDFGSSLVHPQVTDTNYLTNAVTAVGNSGVKFIQAFFTPVSNLFEQAASLPGPIGGVAHTVNKIFSVAGTEGADVAEGLINTLPVTQKTKDTITPLFKEIGSLGAQIVLGKGSDMMQERVVVKTKSIINTLAEDARLKELSRDLPMSEKQVTSPSQQPVVDIKTADSVRSWINEEKPLPPDVIKNFEQTRPGVNELPINADGTVTLYRSGKINDGKIESYSSEPRVGAEPVSVRPENIIANIGGNTMKSLFEKTYPNNDIQSIANKDMLAKYSQLEKEVLVKSQPVTSETFTPKASLDIQAKLVADGIRKDIGNLPEVTRMNLEDQAARAVELVNNKPQDVTKILNGEINPPGDLKLRPIFDAYKNKAIREGDVQGLIDLSKSFAAKESSRIAQELKAHDTSSLEADPLKAIQQLNETKSKVTGSKKIIEKIRSGDVEKSIKAVSDKKAKVKTWSEFIKTLEC